MRAGHPLEKDDNLSFEKLAQQQWLTSTRLSEQWRQISNVFLSKGIDPPKDYIDLDSVLLMKSLLLESDCLAIMSRELVSLKHECDLFHFVDNTPFPVDRTAYLVTRNNSPLQPIAKIMRNELLAICHEVIDKDFWVD